MNSLYNWTKLYLTKHNRNLTLNLTQAMFSKAINFFLFFFSTSALLSLIQDLQALNE